jgi:tetratricopeptide (TPR) repeat protein
VINIELNKILEFSVIRSILASVLVGLVVLSGCSSSRQNIFSKSYHNTTAHYNAYFLAKEDIEEVEAAIWDSYEPDYNKTLKIFAPYDTIVVAPVSDQIEEAIKKASLAIQRHSNSKWVDDSYILVGKARMYQTDFVNAIETFKYVNTKSEDDDARHEALVNLMRTFIEYNELNNAVAVSDFIKKEKLNEENYEQWQLMIAYLYAQENRWDMVSPALEEAVSTLNKNDKRARYHFILGQIYQQQNQDSLSYYHYRRVLKSNPTYELSFYSKLYMAQVTQLADASNLKKIRKYFRKLLRDKKNEEYRDKIYYELAGFEIKNGNHDIAVKHLKKSLEVGQNNQTQRGYSYVRLGELYYDHYRDYRMASAYYDSVVSVLPREDERYPRVSERQQILKEFVEQLEIIETNDSLLALAAMPEEDLVAYLTEYVEEERAAAEEAEKAAKKASRRSSAGATFDPDNPELIGTGSGDGEWYFYNQSLVSRGVSEFKQTWGDRPLEDNWRRSAKDVAFTSSEDEDIVETGEDQADEVPQEEFSVTTEVQQLRANLPATPEAKQQLLDEVEEAYFKLGSIYDFKLEEPENAAETFETMLARFPDTGYAAEVIYELHLIYTNLGNTDKAEYYKNLLLTDHPGSVYAKLILNPDYLKQTDEESEELKALYARAYHFYESDSLQKAQAMVHSGLEQYPNNPFTVQLELLDILIKGKIEGEYRYKFELQKFVEAQGETALGQYAAQLLEATNTFKEKEARRKGATFIQDFEQEHIFILSYIDQEQLSDRLPAAMDHHIDNNFPNTGLNVGNLMLNDNQAMVVVNEFATQELAMGFLRSLKTENSVMDNFDKYEIDKFVITKDNFQLLYQTKALSDYLKFFNTHYNETIHGKKDQ